jgi:hypothetical protein
MKVPLTGLTAGLLNSLARCKDVPHPLALPYSCYGTTVHGAERPNVTNASPYRPMSS